MARNFPRIIALSLTFGCVLLFFGCQPSNKADKSKSPTTESATKPITPATGKKSEASVAEGGKKVASGITKSKTPPPPLTIPKVSLTDSLRATCLVNVGDTMPSGDVLTADGDKVSLQSQYGEKLTVVFFWWEGGSNYARLAADSALKDLQVDIAEPYAEKGVKVIGVNAGDKPRSVQQDLEKIGIKLPYYFDPDKTFFSKVATSILPRIYLLDASGKIIWFDTEYSQSTRRNLMQAIKVVMGEN